MDKAPSVEEHEAFFAEQLENANNVIHLSITDKVNHSGCATAREAAGIFDNVTVLIRNIYPEGRDLWPLRRAGWQRRE